MPPHLEGCSPVVVFTVEGRELRAPKQSLIDNSPYFRTLFSQDPTCDSIALRNAVYEAVKAAIDACAHRDDTLFWEILRRCKSSSSSASSAQKGVGASAESHHEGHVKCVLSLFETCKHFGMDWNAEMSARVLAKHLNSSNVLTVLASCLRYDVADVSGGIDYLRHECLQSIPAQWPTEKLAREWEHMQRISAEALRAIAAEGPRLRNARRSGSRATTTITTIPKSSGGRSSVAPSSEAVVHSRATSLSHAAPSRRHTGRSPSEQCDDLDARIMQLKHDMALDADAHQTRIQHMLSEHLSALEGIVTSGRKRVQALEHELDELTRQCTPNQLTIECAEAEAPLSGPQMDDSESTAHALRDAAQEMEGVCCHAEEVASSSDMDSLRSYLAELRTHYCDRKDRMVRSIERALTVNKDMARAMTILQEAIE